MICTTAYHDALRANAHEFDDATHGPSWELDGYLFKNCVECESTLGIPVCRLCGVGCDADDRLPWGERDDVERVAHFACVSRRMLERGRTKFVIVHGGGKAREFVRS